jgi:hypothetical protein
MCIMMFQMTINTTSPKSVCNGVYDANYFDDDLDGSDDRRDEIGGGVFIGDGVDYNDGAKDKADEEIEEGNDNGVDDILLSSSPCLFTR